MNFISNSPFTSLFLCTLVFRRCFTANTPRLEDEDGDKPLSNCESFNFGKDEILMQNCVELEHNIVLYWELHDDDLLEIYVVSAHTDMWIGFGFNSEASMVGTDAVIGWMNGNEGNVKDYHLYENTIEGVQEKGNQEAVLLEIIKGNGLLGIHFIRPLEVQHAVTIPKDDYIFVCYATGEIAGDFINYHNPSGRTTQMFNIGTGEIQQPDELGNISKQFHAVLMVIGWGLFLPIGVLTARYGKVYQHTWFDIHRGVNCFGLLLTTIGWVIGLTVIGTGAFVAHTTIGIIAMSFAIFQPLNAYFRPRKPQYSDQWPTTDRRRWNLLHWWTGRIALILAFVNIVLGLNMYQVTTPYQLAFYFGVAFLAFIGVVLQIRISRARKNDDDRDYVELRGSSTGSSKSPSSIHATRT